MEPVFLDIFYVIYNVHRSRDETEHYEGKERTIPHFQAKQVIGKNYTDEDDQVLVPLMWPHRLHEFSNQDIASRARLNTLMIKRRRTDNAISKFCGKLGLAWL